MRVPALRVAGPGWRETGAVSRKPNVVLVLTDDQGWGDLSCSGNTNLSTPNIDRLAADGATMEHFYVQPLCAPTRAEILTGRYFARTGVHGVTRRAECLNLDETTIADVFRTGGYATGCFGKWHSGSAYPYHPNGRGFDEFCGFCCGHWSHYFNSTLEHNGEETRGEGYIIDALTDRAMAFIEQHRDEPFFCYVPFNTPHSPFQAPDRWYDKFADAELEMHHRDPEKEDLPAIRCVLAMCENIDWNLGRLVDKVEELGLTNDTVFIYLSDNGPNGCRWNGGMLGTKGWADEGGVRSPCFIKWPSHIPPGTNVPEIAGAIDFLPTLADMCDVEMAGTKPLDGVSLKALLLEGATDWPDRPVYALENNMEVSSIRTRKYRAGGRTGGLYDMHVDPGQRTDIASERPDEHAQLMQLLDGWCRDVIPREISNPALPVGFREFPKTYLNAQDGLPEGDITWPSIHPNASYFINWHNVEDGMEWEIDVQQAGEYIVTLMYTCVHGEEGSVVRVSCGGESLDGTITEPFDPPLKDQDDRVRRVVAYEKPFRPLELGVITLVPVTARLRLQAVSKPGNEVCQLRTVRLDLVRE